MLLLHADYDDAGAVRRTWLVRDAARVGLWDEGAPEARPLPAGAVRAVLERYGRPLEGEVPPPEEAALDLEPPDGPAALRRLRFVPFGYLQPLDYLLWQPAAGEALAAPAPLVAAALRRLAEAA
jgi:hypothetical protein